MLLGAARCQELPQLLQDIFLLWLNNIHRVDDPSGKLQNTGQYSRRSVGSGKLSDSVKNNGSPPLLDKSKHVILSSRPAPSQDLSFVTSAKLELHKTSTNTEEELTQTSSIY